MGLTMKNGKYDGKNTQPRAKVGQGMGVFLAEAIYVYPLRFFHRNF
jgi:hypothetical protein